LFTFYLCKLSRNEKKTTSDGLREGDLIAILSVKDIPNVVQMNLIKLTSAGSPAIMTIEDVPLVL
jgi:hypothetical protein